MTNQMRFGFRRIKIGEVRGSKSSIWRKHYEKFRTNSGYI